jgi:phosphonopyruvate decarboxylase/sulfopyruvate decarboxylase subunit beta
VGVLARLRTDQPVITGPGGASGELWACGHRAPTIYNMELGYAAPMCLGVALSTPGRRVVAVEGDGSLLAGAPALVTIAKVAPPNLVVLAIDNGVYETVGEGSTATGTSGPEGGGACLAGLARASGIPAGQVVECADADQLRLALVRALAEPGPWVVVARTEPATADQRVRASPGLDIVESAVEFRRHLAEAATEARA